MTEVIYELPEKGEARSSSDGKVKTALTKLKERVNGGLGQANFEANAALAGKWYTPTIIATEQSVTSTSFTTLGTADEVTSIVLPSNGLILIRYSALVKCSVESAGRVGLFLGANQIGSPASGSVETSGLETSFKVVVTLGNTTPLGAANGTSIASTGFAAPPIMIAAPASTYTVSAKFKASSGSVTAKERSLHVAVLGI